MSELEKKVEPANPEESHVATVLLLDISGSMIDQDKISQLNEGLQIFKQEICQDERACKRVDLAVITFGGNVEVIQGFTSIAGFEPQELRADGQTLMGKAILKAIEMIEQRKAYYKTNAIDYFRPWIFMITDGEPTDMSPDSPQWKEVVNAVREGEKNRKFLFFAIGVEPANMELLARIAPEARPPQRLAHGKFKELFSWVSKSQQAIANSQLGQMVALPPVKGWAEISSK
jgi:uncharacterized protein YegL